MSDELPKDELIVGLATGEPGQVLAYRMPRKFHHIDDQVIDNVSAYMNLVINLEGSNRDLNVGELIRTAKKLFSTGRNYYGNKFWLQISAASIREVIIFLNAGHFERALPHIPKSTNPQGAEFYMYIGNVEDYLSMLVHYKPISKRVASFRKLHGHDEDYSRITDADYSRDEDILFEQACINLIMTLNGFLADHRN